MLSSLHQLATSLLTAICLLPSALLSAPPTTIPAELYNDFTHNGTIPVIYKYSDDSYSSDQPIIYTHNQIQNFIKLARKKKTNYYGTTDTYLFSAFQQYLASIYDKKVAVIGSRIPWYESILLAYNASPVTIEYNQIISQDPRLEIMTVAGYEANPRQFDAIVSISSMEHDGLGRYGDPINPFGDLEAMGKMKKMLKEGGLLFLAVPVGKDCLVWNLHRVYGKLRLKALLKGWEIVGTFGFSAKDLEVDAWEIVHQPVLVLRPISS